MTRHNFCQQTPAEGKAHSMYFFKEWRERPGKEMTQEELAEKVGLRAPSISQLENGKQWVSRPKLEKIAEVLGCRPGDLLLWSPEEKEALTGKVRGADNIRKLIARIADLTPDNVDQLVSAADFYQQANIALSSQARPGGQYEPSSSRRESSPSR